METSCTTRPRVLAAFRRRLPASLLSGVTLVIHMVLASGCNYYWPQQQTADPAGVASLASSKLFLVHQGNSVWQLQNPQLSGEALQGQKADLTLELRQYATPIIGQGLRYKRRDKHTALNLVHLYLTDSHTFTGSQVSIPLADMQRLEVIERDTGKTIFSHVLVGAGVVGGAYVILGIIVLLTKSSCPFVYAYDGANYQFVGEAYGGAIFAPAERDDYMPLPNLQAQGQEYQLKITNELRERQYTNVAELWLVHHPAATSVLVDSQGNMHTIGRPLAAVQATSDAGTDYTTHLATRDKSALLFNDETPGTAPNSVVLTFPNPTQARAGKLVLHAQNSLWLDYLYGEFTKKFGSYYGQWASTQHNVPARELREWAEQQGVPLRVSIETTQGWQLVEQIQTVGPLASRDLVVPFTVPGTTSSGPIRLKLETGFMFWEVDYAAVDFSADAPVHIEKLTPHSARDEQGRDQRTALATTDSHYLAQTHPGTEVALRYRAASTPTPDHMGTTAFLHTRGYYEHIRNYEGLPNLPELYSFRKPGRFITFSKDKYHQSYQELHLAAATH